MSHSIEDWRARDGRSPWNILQIWTFSTLGYCIFGTWKRLISKAVIVKTNGDSKLFCLTLGGLGGLHVLLLACLVNFSTVLNCRGWNCMWWCRVFFQFLKSGGQKKVRLWNLGKKWGLGVGDRVGGETHFFSLNVILRTFVYLIYVCFA